MAERSSMLSAIGGEAGCRVLSTAFYTRVAAEPALKSLFPGKTVRCATEEFSAFLIQFLGGDERMTQYRWWVSLRESHARFQISEFQRAAWLRHMEAALRASSIDKTTQDSLVQFFISSSAYLVNAEAGPVKEPELARRWARAQALDTFVANLSAGNDPEVLAKFGEFADRPSLFVGVLAKMLQTRRPALEAAVAEAIEHDPTLVAKQSAGRTLLHYAAGAGCKELVAALLRQGVDPNILDNGGHPPLYRAANECGLDTGPEIVRMLILAGADVNDASGITRTTPLHMAARRGYEGITLALLEGGASRDARDVKGCTPFDRATRCRRTKVAQLLSMNVDPCPTDFSSNA